jgi:hypothetical protein
MLFEAMGGLRSVDLRFVVALAFACGACSTAEPDVVASKASPPLKVSTDAGGYFKTDASASLIQGCEPGHYVGNFSTDPSSPNTSGLFKGSIGFSLVPFGTGEFLSLTDNGTVSGSSDSGATFTANVLGETQCKSGTFSTVLYDGEYKIAGLTVPFYGPITGVYFPEHHTFSGTWASYLGTEADGQAVPEGASPLAQGIWVALLDQQ